jgi:hypothetical protein
MATLEKLQEQKRGLEERLSTGDLSAEPALERIDNAIQARTMKIQHSQKRLTAVKTAVKAGVPVEETRPSKAAAAGKKAAKAQVKRPLNRF